jgi:hypothetical protein
VAEKRTWPGGQKSGGLVAELDTAGMADGKDPGFQRMQLTSADAVSHRLRLDLGLPKLASRHSPALAAGDRRDALVHLPPDPHFPVHPQDFH